MSDEVWEVGDGVRFWDYLGCRLDAPSAPHVAPLPQLIRHTPST